MRPVLIVLSGGIADIRYAPPGVQVIVKDYDIQCDAKHCEDKGIHHVDTDGHDFHLGYEDGGTDGTQDKAAEAEAFRIARAAS
jgi:hypothetical protein